MSAKCASKNRRGISLSEAMVSLLILTMVMIVALTLLFSMKSFAERQQVKTAPRQTARRAVDYLSSFVAGATDLNDRADPPSPNAVITWYATAQGASLTRRQASYNNLTAAQAGNGFGEEGTDILTVSVPIDPFFVPISRWPGWQHAANLYFSYTDGCFDELGNPVADGDTVMEQRFKELTGATPNAAGQLQSPILTLVDADGNWAYYQITGYQQFSCAAQSVVIDGETRTYNVHVVSNPGQSDGLNPPGGRPELNDPSLAGGMRFYSFRVRRDANGIPNLEQKIGLFDPLTDNPGTAFTPIMPNVEDFQVAYMYRASPNGTTDTIFNTADAAFPATIAGQTTNGVPPQFGFDTSPSAADLAWDITRVSGLRISITSRSAPVRFESRNISVRRGTQTRANSRSDSEDRAGVGPNTDDAQLPAGTLLGDFDHHRMTATILIRNRMLGN
ncbi:MAG: type IV pilus modification PilV family protein [Thermoanaerobaculia bacterium]